MFQMSLWMAPPIAASALALAAYMRAGSRTNAPGGPALRFCFAMVFVWSAAQAVSIATTSEAATLLASQMAYIGIALAPVAWFTFALTFSLRVMRISRRTLNLISVIPVATILLALTNTSHGLIWSEWRFDTIDGIRSFDATYGVWWYVHAFYSYALILSATSILAFALTQMKQHAQTLLAVICAPLIGIVFNLFYLSPLNPFPWLDITTVGFVLGVLLLDLGVMRGGALNSMPVAREIVIEQLKDPVLVIAANGLIIDANVAAIETWRDRVKIMHANLEDLVQSLPIKMLKSTRKNTEVTLDDRAYEVAATVLDPSNEQSNVALVFRDVTARRTAERDLKRMAYELERLAHTDALTGLYNRRVFMQRLHEEFERVRRHHSVMSVLTFDLDHFKKINDTHGHDQGDAVLIAVADAVNQIKRVTDIACRLGGEEFALLLPETGKTGALHLAERLRHCIETYPYQRKVGAPITVTASIGVATVTPQSPAPETILQVADRALYLAKQQGRNQVCMDPLEPAAADESVNATAGSP